MTTVEDREIYQFLERLKQMGIDCFGDVIRFLHMAYDNASVDLEQKAVDFFRRHDEIYEAYELHKPLPKEFIEGLCARGHNNQKLFNQLFSDHKKLTLGLLSHGYGMTREEAVQTVKDFVFGFEYMQEKTKICVRDDNNIYNEDEF